jgi:NAD(P)-dependent dehydrogenase (short-subunit alcohol dehydrogenase family)
MELSGKIAVVTGAGSGIGRAMCQRFAREGAKLACVDLDGPAAAATAAQVGGKAFTVDVADEDQMIAMIDTVEHEIGPIDLFASNAGIFMDGGPERPNADWQKIWDINVLSHVTAARHVVPRMVARGGGYLLQTASAAGLLNQVGAAPYAVSKHAAVGLAEWLAMTYGDDGIKVSVLCPQAVESAMTAAGAGTAGMDGMISAEAAAEAVVDGLRAERFLILPHAEVATYHRRKGDDYDRWIRGMQRLHRSFAQQDT